MVRVREYRRLDYMNHQLGIIYHPRWKKVTINKSIKEVPIELTRFYSARSRASRKGVDFSITVEDIRSIINLPCVYCNDSRKLSELDRKIPSLGYAVANIVPACRRCNTIKNDTVTYEEMMFIADYLGWRNDTNT